MPLPPHAGRTALVTGATSGIGLQVSLALAQAGARVLMTTRSPARGATAAAAVRSAVPSADVELVTLDLASLASVRAAAADVEARVGHLDLLVDNAGVMAIGHAVTEDGFEAQLATNHLGPFALTGLLVPALLAAPDPRVVVVTSFLHHRGQLRFDDLQSTRSYGRWRAYAQSKLANLLFAAELQRRAEGRLLVASAHPGYARTGLQRGQDSIPVGAALRMGDLFAQSAPAGARPVVHAALADDLHPDDFWGPAFTVRGRPVRCGRSLAAQDPVAAHRLWEVSEELTGVRYPL
jgi:NAD(P)-dependent dehydrogenase (short-subunit alcohol dehydrogenase family)